MKNAILRSLGIVALALGGCVSITSQPKLHVYSEPAGAKVLVNGEDTGFTTPAAIDPVKGEVTVLREGYQKQTRKITTTTNFRYPRWQDGGTADYTIAFCLFRVYRDFFFPFQWYTHESPSRLYFKLEREPSR